MKTTQHTALPWMLTHSSAVVRSDSGEKAYKLVAETWNAETRMKQPAIEEAEANAQFIVTACNAHYELLEALRECITDPGAAAFMQEGEHPYRRLRAINEIARAAIAKAQGKE